MIGRLHEVYIRILDKHHEGGTGWVKTRTMPTTTLKYIKLYINDKTIADSHCMCFFNNSFVNHFVQESDVLEFRNYKNKSMQIINNIILFNVKLAEF